MSASHARSGWRRRWPWLTATAVVVLALVAGGTALARELLAPEPPSPRLPPALAALAPQWTDPILIPTQLPPCLGYAAGGAAVEPDSAAAGGRAVVIRFAPLPGCAADGSDPQVVLTEGPALQSLSGKVGTVSADRLQFAETAEQQAGVQRVTLQWHCFDMMCRLTAVTSAAWPRSALVSLASSLTVAAR